MSFWQTWLWSFDGWIVAAGILCAVSAALLGNFLVLRRLSMLGDAVSHAVLPGLAVAFLISNSRSSLPMFLGAVIVGVLTAFFTQWVRNAGNVDEGASMGVVFTSLFALGLILIVQSADRVDLDAGCVLYGAIELTPIDKVDVGPWRIPRAVVVLGSMCLINALFVVLFFKELKLTSFAPALAVSMGFSTTAMHYALMVLVAVTAVASFESVGNILVVAMFVVPPATAYLLTERLHVMIVLSVVIAAISAVLGHVAAIEVPRWFGFGSTTTAGMMAVMTGLAFTTALLISPRHGLLVRQVRRWHLMLRILADDVVGLLYRREERDTETRSDFGWLRRELLADRWSLQFVLWQMRFGEEVRLRNSQIELTDAGRRRAQQLVRSHRLWEQYLVSEADVDRQRIHDKAERWEHFTDRRLRDQLDRATAAPRQDPHGSAIPEEE